MVRDSIAVGYDYSGCISEGNEDRCYIEDCKKPPKYCIEWHGVDERGEDPLVIYKIYVCENLEHIKEGMKEHDGLGSVDDVTDAKTGELSYLEEVLELIQEKPKPKKGDKNQKTLDIF